MPSEEEEIINLIAEELHAGRPPEMIVEELVQAGLPRGEAAQVVQAVTREISGGGRGGARKPPKGGGMPWVTVIMVLTILILLWFLLS
ncbi:hypothetical protein K8R43_02840 [archaeon]|nr:hypothetical protein [archaeon]